VEITIADNSSTDINTTVQMTPLVYADGGTEIVYVGGAVIRSERESAVMIRDPPSVSVSQRSLPAARRYHRLPWSDDYLGRADGTG